MRKGGGLLQLSFYPKYVLYRSPNKLIRMQEIAYESTLIDPKGVSDLPRDTPGTRDRFFFFKGMRFLNFVSNDAQ